MRAGGTRRRNVWTILICAVLCLLWHPAAFAQSGTGDLDSWGVSAQAETVNTGSGQGGPADSPRSGSARPDPCSGDFYCKDFPRDLDGLPLDRCPPGYDFGRVRFDTTTNTPLSRRCFNPANSPDTPVVFEPVIDLTQVHDLVPWPTTTIELSPPRFGVVNLATWAWHQPPAVPGPGDDGTGRNLSLTVTATDIANDVPVTLQIDATITGWCYRFDDDRTRPRPAFTPRALACPGGSWTTSPGADHQRRHARDHTYRRPGTHTVTVEQRWEATARLVGGPVPRTWTLGPVTRTFQRAYDVHEIHAVLR